MPEARRPPDKRRTRWVYLRDVPKGKRVNAAHLVIRRDDMRAEDALDLILFALDPPAGAGGWVCPEAVA